MRGYPWTVAHARPTDETGSLVQVSVEQSRRVVRYGEPKDIMQ